MSERGRIEGVVRKVSLEVDATYAERDEQGRLLIPSKVRVTLRTPAEEVVYAVKVCGKVFEGGYLPGPTEQRSPWPFVISCPSRSYALAVWEGDVLEVEGTIERRVSLSGNPYVQVQRATVVSLYRPEWGRWIVE